MEQQEKKKDAQKNAEQEPEAKVWYAIRVTFNREMKVKDDLDLRGIESFVPMRYVMSTRRGRRVKKLVPSIHNLIFFHIEPSLMKKYKAETKLPIRYIMNPATKSPVIVPEREMNNFIAVAGIAIILNLNLPSQSHVFLREQLKSVLHQPKPKYLYSVS